MLSYLRTGPYAINDNLIQMTIAGTMSIFGAMVVLGALLIMFGLKLGYSFAVFLFFSLLFLIIGRLISLFMGTYSVAMRGFAVLSLVVFSLYIIYDTNHILQREYYGDFITASLDYYLDIINVFVNLLSLHNN
jgi:FtsH-binding integral membrane protein